MSCLKRYSILAGQKSFHGYGGPGFDQSIAGGQTKAGSARDRSERVAGLSGAVGSDTISIDGDEEVGADDFGRSEVSEAAQSAQNFASGAFG